MSEELPIKEQKVDIRNLTNILYLNNEQRQLLSDQLVVNQGSARVIMHLFNNSYSDEDYQDKTIPVLEKSIRMHTPIIFGIREFEDIDLADFFNEHFGYLPENIYYYRTISDDSMPYFHGCTNSMLNCEIEYQYAMAWRVFADILKSLGVKKLVFSGI